MKEESPKTFGEWLQITLHNKRMTGAEFGVRAKLSKSAVYYYLSDKRVPDDSALEQIAQALKLNVEQIPPFEKRKPGRPHKVA